MLIGAEEVMMPTERAKQMAGRRWGVQRDGHSGGRASVLQLKT